ncbi:MAG: alpha/beta fold hydrolase [Deltaproteobacteria bacterium]|nr:alpha/beta fold hydrolase [Deltaproteobacteria bacterium]
MKGPGHPPRPPGPALGGLARLLQRATKAPPTVGATPTRVVHHENKWRLLRYEPRAGGPCYRTPLLLVPSLINRHYVLDLMPGKSFVEYLVGAGHDVFVIDWGTPGDEDRHLTFDDIVDGYLGRAVRVAARYAGVPGVHLLGYCLGGTLAIIHAAARPERIASLAVLAAPVRFGDEGLLSAWTRTRSFDLEALVAALGNVPWQLLQSAFHLLRPTLNLSKAVHLLDRAWDDAYLDGFFALETWGNDNVAFPGAAYRTLVGSLYREDALAAGTLRLSGRPVALRSITCPTLAVTFEHDNIVPWPSAAALLDAVGATDKERIHLPGGHVGAVVSRAASRTLWPQLQAWWAARDGASDVSTPRRPRSRAAT